MLICYYVTVSLKPITVSLKPVTVYQHVKDHRQTPFPFVDDAKVRHKKAPDKEKNARGIVWGKWEWFRESFSR